MIARQYLPPQAKYRCRMVGVGFLELMNWEIPVMIGRTMEIPGYPALMADECVQAAAAMSRVLDDRYEV